MLRSTAHDERRSLRAQGPRGGAAAVRACAALACLLLLALPLGSAYAQAAANDRGHETPILREDAQALRLHPAQLAYVSGAHASVMLRGGDEGVRGGAALALGIPSLLGVGYGWESTTDVASLHRLGVAIGGCGA